MEVILPKYPGLGLLFELFIEVGKLNSLSSILFTFVFPQLFKKVNRQANNPAAVTAIFVLKFALGLHTISESYQFNSDCKI